MATIASRIATVGSGRRVLRHHSRPTLPADLRAFQFGRSPPTNIVHIGAAVPGDVTTLAALLAAYLRESFPGHLGTCVTGLEQDVLSGASGLRDLLAERRGTPIGWVAVERLAGGWCIRAGEPHIEPTACS